jgi:hypothetical protein
MNRGAAREAMADFNAAVMIIKPQPNSVFRERKIMQNKSANRIMMKSWIYRIILCCWYYGLCSGIPQAGMLNLISHFKRDDCRNLKWLKK